MTMPAFNTIYSFYSDEVARLADSIVIENDTSPSLAGDDQYAPAALIDDNPAKVAKIGDTSGAWIFSYPSAQRIDLAALFHHSFDATDGSPDVSVRLEGNATNDFTTPTFSASFVIPAWLGAGDTRWPQNPWMDLTQETGYSETGFQYWRLIIENNSQNIQLGQVRFHSAIYRFEPDDLRWGLTTAADRPQVENRTSFGISTIYPRQTAIWSREADLQADDVLAATLERHWHDVGGRAYPFVLIPAGPGSDDRAYLVRYAMTDRQAQWNFDNWHAMRLGFQEVGRGLRPGV